MRQNGTSARPRAAQQAPPYDAPLTERIDERRLLEVLTALRKGEFSSRLPVKWTGMAGRIADTVNEIVDTNQRAARELDRLARVVGKEGRITYRAPLGDFSGAWAASLESVNTLVGDLVAPTSEMARVIGAVAKGDLTQSVALDFDGRALHGEFLRTAKTV